MTVSVVEFRGYVGLLKLSYLLKRTEVSRIWPSSQLLTDFVDTGGASSSVTFLVDNYFDRLLPVLSKTKNEVRQLYFSAKRSLGKLTQTMAEYNESMIIGGDFVRYVRRVKDRLLLYTRLCKRTFLKHGLASLCRRVLSPAFLSTKQAITVYR